MCSKKRELPAQSKRFIEAARELGCDEDTSAADALMGRLARTPPQPKVKKGVKPTKVRPSEDQH